ncbi:MAG: CheR family methyltransferase, partial [bacterium]
MQGPSVDFSGAALFKSAVALHLGLRFDDDKLPFLDEILARRVRARGKATSDYLRALIQDGPDPEELDALAEALTVTETYFFRGAEQFEALATEVLPSLRASQGAGRIPRLLSAACASGEEPYSLAILLKERFPDFLQEGTLLAVDMHPAMLKTALAGVYGSWSLRESPSHLRERYFRAAGKKFRLREDVRSAVRFEQRNLADENADLWQEGSLDVIFCRNLLMYLEPESAVLLVGRMAQALTPGGHLFLGHAETLRGLSRDFELCQTQGVFYYRRLAAGRQGADARTGWAWEGPPPLPRASVEEALVRNPSWFEAIG